uniref:glutamate receptor 3.6-like n=1 Tax=Erigeron canadensis TaxID=72917 RepID=UPI001CB99657|nr:glutamate receptor 3.6-like [Erigeron canadensis]
MESESVAIIGPQSSVLAHMISNVANELQVPLLSFTATDPTLFSRQNEFFVLTTHSDLFQMAAIADLVEYYGWRQVAAVYIDDDHGRNGITSLADQLSAKRCKISHRAPIKPKATHEDIKDVLLQVAFMESRIFVVHTYANMGLEILEVAQYIGMMDSGYVWITTDWLSTVMDISSPLPKRSISAMQGVITLRSYRKDSFISTKFETKWENLTTLGLSMYSQYAYDTIWLLAHALDKFFNQGANISFSKYFKMKDSKGRSFNLDSLRIFNGGKVLLENILKVKMNGTTGPIQFTSDKNLAFPAFEVINVIGTGLRRVGYWSNSSGLSTSPPKNVDTNRSRSSQTLHNVIWPGETFETPLGRVFSPNGDHLKIGVPHRVSFVEFVKEVKKNDTYVGYCIDVFHSAINLLPYAVPYKFYSYGDGHDDPSYTNLISAVNDGVYDAAIGEIAIITNRTRMADFTQPFIESGLVVVAPVRKLNSGHWAFLRPFTGTLWCTTGIFFLVVGSVIWMLEHRKNDQFRGPPKQQITTTLSFIFSTLFFSHKQEMRSTLGQIVLIIWLFMVLIISNSYTASLTSILTVEKLYSPIEGIDSLISSKVPIGYQQNSFVRDYLVKELKISETRLVPLNLPEDYEKALLDGPGNGGVAAVVDERPYIELFLSTRCEFSIVGQEFTKNGWGFAFQKDSLLAVDISNAILKMSENGELQRIHDKWLTRSACSSQDAKLTVDQLQLKSFEGLFFICGLVCFLALFLYLVQIIYEYKKYKPKPSEPSGCIQTFVSYFDEKQESVKARSKKRVRVETSHRRNGDL